MSLLARILLLVLLATLTPAAVIGYFLFERRDGDIEEARHNLGALAKYAGENLDDKVRGTVQLLYGLSRARDLDAPDKAACSAFLAGVLRRYPQYTGLLTITPDGDLLCDSLNSGRELNLSARAYFRQVKATRAPAFDVVFGALTGIAVLQVAYPVLDAQGTLKYVLLASLNLSEYAQSFVATNPYPSLRMLIWDRQGNLLVRSPDTGGGGLVGRNFSASELFRAAAGGAARATADLPDMEGVPWVWAKGVLPEPHSGGASIMLGIPTGVLVAEANSALRNALAILIAVSLLAFLGAWYVAETGIRRHVRRMADVARRVGAGDLDARIGAPYPKGELGELMAVVDRTSGAVQAQQEEIELRSRDLQRANRMLRMLSGINTLIVRVKDRKGLFDEACQIAVEHGGFGMVWIGLFDSKTLDVTPAACAGCDAAEEWTSLKATARDIPEGQGSIGRAIREKRPVMVNDMMLDPALGGARRREAVRRGFRSVIALPLIVEGGIAGVFVLLAKETDFFSTAEATLLTELAGDLSFALEHLAKRERLTYLAYYDVLTGLANRSLFLDRVAQYLRNAVTGGHKLALLLFDVERFKSINESLGRPAGDALLRQVAEWLRLNVGGGDASLLARVDADRFAVVLPEVAPGAEVAGLVENAMRAILEHPFRMNDGIFRVAVKAGVGLFPDDGGDADALLKNAEAALKDAKTSGERYTFYTRSMNARVAEKLALENQLRQALDKNEFVLHYQPKVTVGSGTLSGAEALIQWNDPRTGLVPPGLFIPILEEMGLIRDVGQWALRKALEDCLRWRVAGLPAVRIAVNVSPLQLRSRGFIDEIRQAIGAHPHAAAGLELEITESLIMADVSQSIASLQAIRALGVTIAIDHFGAGFSSLSSLAKLPVDTLKIDRSIVTDMTGGPQGLALVSTIINLARSLKLKVVAEGVETEEQSRLLQLLRCDEMQGFLLSRPLPAEIFEAKYLALPAAA